MRAFTKQQPPTELSAWRPNTHSWNDFVQDVVAYTAVKTTLITEQQQLCRYCENRLVEDACHIEHIQPRHGPSGDPARTFDYANLACSCNGGSDANRHCGHYKGHKYDRNRFIIPSVEASAPLFSYTVEGQVGNAPGLNTVEQERVHYTIETLNLNCPRLANMRRSHAKGLQEAIQGLIDANATDQIDDLALFYVIPDEQGRLYPFFSLSRQLLGARADAVLELCED
jgi:uncharacterized protein (TIGR02646 family)